MTGYRTCRDCTAPVKLHDRDRCHTCHRRALHAELKRSCRACGQLRHLRPGDLCADCVRAAGPSTPPKTITCLGCGEQRRNVGHGLCNRCALADPDRPFRYAASLAARMPSTPPWWHELTTFVCARYHPGGAMIVLRTIGRILLAEPNLTAQQLLNRCAPVDEPTSATTRTLTAFFTGRGLILPSDQEQQQAGARRRHYSDGVPTPLRSAIIQFDQAQLHERERARQTSRHQLSDTTLETKLRILRDLAAHLTTARHVNGWSEITTTDLEAFLARAPQRRHQQTYVLRHFFRWARHRKLVLIDPSGPLRLGAQPAFTGTILDTPAQRALFRRWSSSTVHPHERLAGLLALLHAASNAEIRTLTITDVHPARHAIQLDGRPFPTPLDPVTWTAIEDCLHHRDALQTLNPHVIVTRVTRTRDTPADSSYLTRRLAAAGTTPATCRQTRLCQLVTDLDPKLTATALGMQDNGLVRYLADNVDHDRLTRSFSSRQ